MKKPEKYTSKETYEKPSEVDTYYNGKMQGYNQACDDWEKWLRWSHNVEKAISKQILLKEKAQSRI